MHPVTNPLQKLSTITPAGGNNCAIGIITTHATSKKYSVFRYIARKAHHS